MAGAPDTQRGLAPSVLNFAFDLGTALDIVAGVRLGPGKISVHPAKLGVVGTVSAARPPCSPRPACRTSPPRSAALFPTVTSPPAEQPAATLKVPGLILTAPGDPKIAELQRAGAFPRMGHRHAAHRQQSPVPAG